MKKIFIVLFLGIFLCGCFDDDDIGIIGGADGPTSIILSEKATERDNVKMVKVGGNLYYETGEDSEIFGRCGVLDGEITKTVDRFQIPQADGEANFTTGEGWQAGAIENTIEIPIGDDWEIFKKLESNIDFNQYKYCYILEGRMKNAVDDSEFLVLSNDLDTTFEEAAYNLLGSDKEKMKDIFVLPIRD